MSIETYNEVGYDSYLNTEDSLYNNRAEPNEAITSLQGGVSSETITPEQIPERSIPASKMEWNLRGWTHTMVFSATADDQVDWTAGTITLNDEVTTFSISAGNTGAMIALTYVYFDINVSKTELQVTTTATNAIGMGKIMIAVAQNNADATKLAIFQVFGGAGGVGTFISTASQIAANIITANEMLVNSLSAITTTTGTLIIDAAGYIRGGQTDYNTGAGFFVGYSGGAYKLSIGNPASDYLTWDGTNLASNKFGLIEHGTFTNSFNITD